ncbi:MAG: hypothetical protein AMJ90_05220 [candidate division Zixibacteria bacterium SM23_73_2]|nr:MAG: hypothetical protein AMJ90_05220 [candidate division Zixibacteria bacterium SM23_73_2]
MQKNLTVLVFILIFFISIPNCGKRITPSSEDKTIFAIKDYFPLNIGDKWLWEIGLDSLAEPYRDGDSVLGEPFTDLNGNGVWDMGEPFQDYSLDGHYEGPDSFDYRDLNLNGKHDPGEPSVPFADVNLNGRYDAPNYNWDPGEPFCDLNDNQACDWIRNKLELEAEILSYGIWVHGLALLRCAFFPVGSDSIVALGDAFTNDSLGLRWHGHIDWTSPVDYLLELNPITIAKKSTQVGDLIFYADGLVLEDSVYIFTWVSNFVGKEEVSTSAGKFTNCLKFKSEASGWIGNMAKWNGSSFQWYAQGVGLVKSSGPGSEDYWLLEKAVVGGETYP